MSLLMRCAGEEHLQPEPMRPRQPAVQVVGCVHQTEVNHDDTGPVVFRTVPSEIPYPSVTSMLGQATI